MNQLEEAIKIALTAHSNQKTRTGQPYILHPLHIMQQMNTEEEMIVALLHDVIEDSDVTIEQLINAGFNNNTIDAIKLLTRNKEEDYFKYIEQIKTNTLAVKVKTADLIHNLTITGFNNIEKNDFERINKYLKALRILKT